MRIALIEASHWHVPLYLDAIEGEPGTRLVAVSDATGTRGPGVASRFGASPYSDWRELVAAEQIDFAFVFGRHSEMAGIAVGLIERGIPFAIEKPVGVCAAHVEALRQLAASRRHFVAVPLILGFSGLLRHLESAVDGPDDWRHMSFRFMAGPASRYKDSHCDWMLDPTKAGGGCTINLSVHFVDLVQRLTRSPIRSVCARMVRDPQQADVEIYSVVSMQTEAGHVSTVETGYTYPGGTAEQREFSFSLASRRSYVRSTPDGMTIVANESGKRTDIALNLNTDVYYAEFVRRTLRDMRQGREPAAGLAQMVSIMRVIDRAYESNRSADIVGDLAELGVSSIS